MKNGGQWSQSGFTLTELLVSLGIIAVMATVVFANIRFGSGAQRLELQADNLVSILREAQVLALAGQPLNGEVPSGGYGIYIPACTTAQGELTNTCEYNLFADLNENLAFESNELLNTTVLSLPLALSMQTSLPLTQPLASLTIVFRPPQPLVCINTDCGNDDFVELELYNTTNLSAAHYQVRLEQASGKISANKI